MNEISHRVRIAQLGHRHLHLHLHLHLLFR